MNWARALANLIALVHAAWVAFIVLGLAAILLGIVFRWDWVRNFWFRTIHLTMILVVVAESLAGLPCPLTIWEHQLRQRAGQAVVDDDFIAYWVHQLIFYEAEPWVFTTLYLVFGLAVLAAFLFAPPRWNNWGIKRSDS